MWCTVGSYQSYGFIFFLLMWRGSMTHIFHLVPHIYFSRKKLTLTSLISRGSGRVDALRVEQNWNSSSGRDRSVAPGGDRQGA